MSDRVRGDSHWYEDAALEALERNQTERASVFASLARLAALREGDAGWLTPLEATTTQTITMRVDEAADQHFVAIPQAELLKLRADLLHGVITLLGQEPPYSTIDAGERFVAEVFDAAMDRYWPADGEDPEA